MYIPPTASTRVQAFGVFTHILREASASFALSAIPGIPEPQRAKGQQYGSHAFFAYKRL